MNFKISQISVTVMGFDWSKKQFSLKFVIPLDNHVIQMDVDVNKYDGQQMKVSVELGDGVPF